MSSYLKEYDYIIVGCGSAGNIVARRLSEDSNVKILMLDAGTYGNDLFKVPSLGLLLQKSVFDWQYQTVPQKHSCFGLNNNISSWPMGKIVGGTSKLNNMVYIRGHPEDFKQWNFDYEHEILPYFEKLERLIEVNSLPFKSVLSQSVLEAANSLGIPVSDESINSNYGFFVPKATIFAGERWSSADLVRNIPNIHVKTNAFVEKVLFGANYEANGVKFWTGQTALRVRARKGVILSAGVIGTPKILFLSGIGPSDHLKELNIKQNVVLEEVGENLQDHVTTGLDLILLNASLGVGIEEMLSPYSAFTYFSRGSGPWTTIGCENIGFTKFEKRPNLQFMILPVGITTDSGVHLRTLSDISDKSWHNYFRLINETAITILPIALHPKSRGFVRLKDNNFKTPPIIDPNYLSDPYDSELTIDGINLIKELIESEPLRKLGAKLNRLHFPGCEPFQFDTKPYWECYIRHLTITSYHPVGTCKMGTVVDYDFKVIGTNKLYVVDGSVFPSLTSGNINAAIMMLAEKASDIIKRHDYSNSKYCYPIEIFFPNKTCNLC